MRPWLRYVLAILAVAAFVAWIARSTYWEDALVPTSQRGEAARNPFYSVQRLADALGARTEWRKTLGDMPPANAVMVLKHWNWSLIDQRRRQLERWVEGGGRLVIDATFVPGDKDRFRQWSGLSRELDYQVPRTKTSPPAKEQVPDPALSYSRCVQLRATVPAAEKDAAPVYSICTIDWRYTLRSRRDPLWALAQEGRMQVVRVPVGRGSVTMVNARPFGNRELVETGHGLLFAAVTQLRAGDQIVFLSEGEYASLLELIWTHAAPAVLLAVLLIGVALWRNGARFGPPATIANVARRSLAEQIVGTGRFTLRVGGGQALHAAALRALHEAATKRIAGYERMSPADRVAQLARLAQTDAEELAGTINYSGIRRAGELKHAVELLEVVRRRLLSGTSGEIVHAG